MLYNMKKQIWEDGMQHIIHMQWIDLKTGKPCGSVHTSNYYHIYMSTK